MKALIVIIALSAIGASYAQVKTKTEGTGNIAVASVTNCNYPEIVKDFAGNDTLRSQFTVNLCNEIKTYQVQVHNDGKWYTWNDKETVIAGSEKLSYQWMADTKKASETVNPQDLMQNSRVYHQCNELRDAYRMQIGTKPIKCN